MLAHLKTGIIWELFPNFNVVKLKVFVFLDALASLRSIAAAQNLGILGQKPRNPLTNVFEIGFYKGICMCKGKTNIC